MSGSVQGIVVQKKKSSSSRRTISANLALITFCAGARIHRSAMSSGYIDFLDVQQY